MTITGFFNDLTGRKVTVTFTKNDGTATTRTIGENGLFFAREGVIITDDNEDEQTVIRMTGAEITLVTEDYEGDNFFASNDTQISVTITRGGVTLFSGYVDPQTYSQAFSGRLNEFTVNCIDKLATLQYHPYFNATPDNYETVRTTATTERSFYDILDAALPAGRILYDCSKGIDNQRLATVFSDCGVSDFVFLGDDADNVSTWEEAVTEILRYLNLHIRQQGDDFIIYDNDSVAMQRNTWVDIRTGLSVVLPTPSSTTLTSAMHAADDTNVSVNQSYNQITLTCKMDDGKEFIVNPLDSDTMTSQFANKQIYMQEFDYHRNGALQIPQMQRWIEVVRGNELPDGEEIKVTDWWMQIKENKNWRLRADATRSMSDVVVHDGSGVAIIQDWVTQWSYDHDFCPCFVSFGSVEHRPTTQNNEPIGTVGMTDYLYISVNLNDSETGLRDASPAIEYTGNDGAATISPTDDNTTNYLVFSGSFTLQPKVEEAETFQWWQTNTPSPFNLYDYAVPYGDEDDTKQKYYTRKFYTQRYSNTPADYSARPSVLNLQPPTDGGVKSLKYNYSQVTGGTPTDLVDKLPILECELIIGTKRLVETDTNVFQWVTIGNEPTVTVDGVQYAITTFTLGCNPALHDFIVGGNYKIQNTVTTSMNLNTQGTAIPISKADGLHGAIIFRILGPINTTWNQITRRHPTWFRHTTYQQNDVEVLTRVQNIIMSDFKCVLVSDNALNSVDESKELIYMSDESHNYIEKLEAEDWTIITQPTSSECVDLGIKNKVCANAVSDMVNGVPLASIYNAATGETAKAEQHYVDSLYRSRHIPRVTMTATLHDSECDHRGIYTSTPLGRDFSVQSVAYNLADATATMNFVEI